MQHSAGLPDRHWLKTYGVHKMLGDLFTGTMQTMRDTGMLPYILLNGLALYKYKDVVTLMDELKIEPTGKDRYPGKARIR